jgi:hypothetical protein
VRDGGGFVIVLVLVVVLVLEGWGVVFFLNDDFGCYHIRENGFVKMRRYLNCTLEDDDEDEYEISSGALFRVRPSHVLIVIH